MQILPDNDVTGAVLAIQHVLESSEWNEYTSQLNIRFTDFEELGLPRDATDETVWKTCQKADVVLITGNRAGGKHSLEETIQADTESMSLPVITIADPQRIVRDRDYEHSAALSLLDLVERIESLRGTGRLFIP